MAKCKDPKKNFDYICDKFASFAEKKVTVEEADVEIAPKKKKKTSSHQIIVKKSKAEYDQLNFEQLAKDFNNQANLSPLPPDIKIDDRDFKQAKNFLEFTTSKKYLGIIPFAKQLEIGLLTFGEVCHNKKCTDLDYVYNIPKKATPDDILERITPLTHGKCPKCGYRKNEMFKDKVMKVAHTGAAMCGQRCIVGSSLIATQYGIMPFKKLKVTSLEGFTKYNGPNTVLENGAIVKPTKFFMQHNQTVHRVSLKNGYKITGTLEHPLLSKDDYIKIKNLQVGDPIPLIIGQNIWGTKTLNLINDVEPLFDKAIKLLDYNSKLIEIEPYDGPFTADLYRLLGYWVSEGSGGRVSITNQDKKVLKDCKLSLEKLYGRKNIIKKKYLVESRIRYAYEHFNILLEGHIEDRSAKKCIPQHVLSAPKEMIREFMRALFEGDGGFNGKAIEYCSISKLLIRQVSAVLHNFGIIHCIRYGTTWASNGTVNQIHKPKYSIFIEGVEGLTQFKTHIGFISKRKYERLDITVEALQNQLIKMPYWYDKFPELIKQEYINLIKDIAKSISIYKVPEFNSRYSSYRLRASYGIRSLFHNDHTFWRLYKSDNVALSKQRIRLEVAHLQNGYNWRLVPLELKNKLSAFTNKYLAVNHYWTTVISNRKLKKKHTVYDIHVPDHHRFMANGLVNHNSGKSALVSMMHAYMLHANLKLQNAPKVYGLLDNEILEDTLVALTATKAKDLMYSKIEGYLTQSKWFIDYHKMLDHYGNQYGEELYRVRDMFASYRCRSLLIKASDPDMRKLRGATRNAASVDEIAWFISGKNNIKFDAVEIVAAINNSFETVRNAYYDLLKQGMDGLLQPLFFNISSPSSTRDLIVKACREAEHDPMIIAWNYATWDFNPKLKKKNFTTRMRRDPIGTLRDFGAVPPNSSSPYISDIEHIKGIVQKTRKNMVNFTPQTIRSMGGKQMGSGIINFTQPKDNIKRIMALDAGINCNSFSIVCGFFDEKLEQCVYDTFVEIPASFDLPLNYNDIYDNIICPMVEQLNINLMVADRFQSLKILQDTEARYEIIAETYSVKYSDFDSCRTDLLDHNIIIPRPEFKKIEEIMQHGEENYPHGYRHSPIAHFLYQVVTVQDLKKEVIKGEGLTDDLFRAFVLAYSYLIDPKYQELVTGTTNTVQKIIDPTAGTMVSRYSSSGLAPKYQVFKGSNQDTLISIASRGGAQRTTF